MPEQRQANHQPERRKRIRFSDVLQRISYETLKSHFHQPLHRASKELGICDTFLKKICRHWGMTKWPYRDVRRVHTVVRKLVKHEDAPEHVKNAAVPSRQDFDELSTLHASLSNLQKKKKPARDRTAVWDTRKRRKLAGMAAPLTENVHKYLAEHPHCELYTGQDAYAYATSPTSTSPPSSSCSDPSSAPSSSTVGDSAASSHHSMATVEWEPTRTGVKQEFISDMAPLSRQDSDLGSGDTCDWGGSRARKRRREDDEELLDLLEDPMFPAMLGAFEEEGDAVMMMKDPWVPQAVADCGGMGTNAMDVGFSVADLVQPRRDIEEELMLVLVDTPASMVVPQDQIEESRYIEAPSVPPPLGAVAQVFLTQAQGGWRVVWVWNLKTSREGQGTTGGESREHSI